VQPIALTVEGVPVDGSVLEDENKVLVPLDRFCEVVRAEVKVLDGLPYPAVCKGDLCIPLNAADVADTVLVSGKTLVYLDALTEPLSLRVQTYTDRIEVKMVDSTSGLGPGQKPPVITLPDLFTGESISSSDYLGRKVVFYMWASW
jgi:hypothetical protein